MSFQQKLESRAMQHDLAHFVRSLNLKVSHVY